MWKHFARCVRVIAIIGISSSTVCSPLAAWLMQYHAPLIEVRRVHSIRLHFFQTAIWFVSQTIYMYDFESVVKTVNRKCVSLFGIQREINEFFAANSAHGQSLQFSFQYFVLFDESEYSNNITFGQFNMIQGLYGQLSLTQNYAFDSKSWDEFVINYNSNKYVSVRFGRNNNLSKSMTKSSQDILSTRTKNKIPFGNASFDHFPTVVVTFLLFSSVIGGHWWVGCIGLVHHQCVVWWAHGVRFNLKNKLDDGFPHSPLIFSFSLFLRRFCLLLLVNETAVPCTLYTITGEKSLDSLAVIFYIVGERQK